MTKYKLEMDFGTQATKEEVEGWAEQLLVNGPEGAGISISREPLVLAAEDLHENHVGYTVEFVTRDHWHVHGKLDAIYKRGGKNTAVLIVDDEAWDAPYTIVTVVDW